MSFVLSFSYKYILYMQDKEQMDYWKYSQSYIYLSSKKDHLYT